MRIKFIKMHGLGNDFVVLDARNTALPAMTTAKAAALSDRNTGIGCDQLILLEAANDAEADCTMRIFNADGGEVEACGNAARAIGLLLSEPSKISTKGGIIETSPSESGIAVDMGEPRLDWNAIPLAYAVDTLSIPAGWDELEQPVGVNVGNPHAVFFVEDHNAIALGEIGPRIENDELFPERVNVNVATIKDEQTIHLRVWERGVGETRACGTGACATAVAAMRRKLTSRDVTVHLPGGQLQIAWGEDNRIIMTGPATESFRGSFEWDEF